MIDVELTQDSFGNFDISLENGDLKGEDGFDTAIWVSLFTDARAPESKVVVPENRRGWVGNTVSPVENRELGGLLWLAEQRRLTQDTLNEIIDYARKSLSWLVEDEIAVNVEVTGVIIPQQGIQIQIDIQAPSGDTSIHYVPLWELTGV